MQSIYWWGTVWIALVAAVEAARRLEGILKIRNSADTRDTVKQATGIVATLAALVLGLLIANGQKSFEQQSNAIASIVVGVAQLDETLMHFGEPSGAAREDLRLSIKPILYSLWDKHDEADFTRQSRERNEAFIMKIMELPEDTPQHKLLKASAYDTANRLVQERFQLALLEKSKVPSILMFALILWTIVVFLGLGLCSDGSAISRLALYVGAAATATAVFLVVEYQTPFTGSIQISRASVDLLSSALLER